MHANDLDPTYLVPCRTEALLETFAAIDGYAVAEGVVTRDGRAVVTPIADVVGGCAVRLAARMGDGMGIADMLSDEAEAARLREADAAALDAEDAVVRLGAVPARLAHGSWRPVVGEERAAWAAHLGEVNSERTREVANENRGKWDAAA